MFWTFNKSFLLKLIEKIESLKFSVLKRWAALLLENAIPYTEPLDNYQDEKLKWCFVKNGHLKKDPKYSQMYLLDHQNRAVILNAVEKRIAEFAKPLLVDMAVVAEDETLPVNRSVLFLDVLRGDPNETLDFIRQKTEEAGFEFNLFMPVPRLAYGKNPYELNGCIAAMIDHLYKLNYFKKEFALEQIFKAYLK